MKRTLRRSTLTLILAIACIGALIFFSFRLVMNCKDWVQQAYNGHMGGSSGLAQAGAIYDRNSNVLAKSVEGKRIYSESATTRKSLLHVVGDDTLNISTAVQSMYRGELTGYSFIWGLGMPASLRSNNDITLTIDTATCNAAYEALGSHSGACVIYNYKTGEIICSVSTKTYDPNAPPDADEIESEQYEGVYLDNVMSSSYSPGSIFKLITSAAALENGNITSVNDNSYYCSGSEKIGGDDESCRVNCYNSQGHGDEDFQTALAKSCNVYFANLAAEIGVDKMTETANKMGINTSYDVSNIPTKKGNYDVSDANKNELAWSGVGQYNDLVNPMQMAIICSAVANDGVPVLPYLVSSKTGILTKLGLTTGGGKGSRMFSSNTASILGEAMSYVTSYNGYSGFGGLDIACKTGTAEIGNDKNNAWFVGYSKDEDCPLAFAVVVEGVEYSETGSRSAMPIAKAAISQAVESLNK